MTTASKPMRFYRVKVVMLSAVYTDVQANTRKQALERAKMGAGMSESTTDWEEIQSVEIEGKGFNCEVVTHK